MGAQIMSPPGQPTRVLILGDSLACPQPRKGQPLEKTWPVLLGYALGGAEIFNRARPRHCLRDVAAELFFFTESLDRFRGVVIQSGIVDCTPRPYPRCLYRLLEILVPRARLRKFERFSHERLLWLYGRPWVSAANFTRLAEELVRTCSASQPGIPVLFVAIAPPTKALSALLPGIGRNVDTYNLALKTAVAALRPQFRCEVVDPYAGHPPEEVTIADGQHMTCESHVRLAGLLRDSLKSLS